MVEHAMRSNTIVFNRKRREKKYVLQAPDRKDHFLKTPVQIIIGKENFAGFIFHFFSTSPAIRLRRRILGTVPR